MAVYDRVLVTGGSGFVGRHVVERVSREARAVHTPRSAECDLTSWEQTRECFAWFRPELVIHCAALYGGIRFNGLYPGRIMHQNLLMGINVIEASRQFVVARLLVVGSASAYPGYLDRPAREEDLWAGPPHEAIGAYGGAKRVLALMVQSYRREYGLNGIYVIPPNLYGPWDTFDPDRSHVLPALLRRLVEAKETRKPTVEVWGTGRPLRDFLYIDDCVEGLLMVAAQYNEELPLNIGTGIGTSIRRLAELARDGLQYQGALTWNPSRPDGQAMILLDVTRMKKLLRWEPPTSLEEGLKRTVRWYLENREVAHSRS